MKKLMLSVLAITLMVLTIEAQTKKTPVKPSSAPSRALMKNLLDSFSYAAGVSVAQNMKEQGIDKLNSELMLKAIDDVMKNKTTLLNQEQCNMSLQEQLRVFQQKKLNTEKGKGAAFLAQNKTRAGVVALSNGLQYEVLKSGQPGGAKPTAVDTVVVHYIGTFIDGKEFDSSVKSGQPITFKLTGVIRGWTEILQLMSIGDKWKVFIPSDLGYGDQGYSPTIPPGATLIFDIELVDIKPAVKP
jgi:FKBP-type peptidyl-prolyl cis-trans isomerase FklB